MKSVRKLIIFVAIIIAILLINVRFDLTGYFSDIDNMKAILTNNFQAALLTYILFTTFACTVLALPGITFAVIAGLVFGPIWGSFACLIATTLGASIAFLVGRFFLKDSIKPKLEKNKLLKKLLFNNNKESEIILLMITRLVPIFPYNIQNFAYGITDISFWKYTGLTFLFMIPGVGIYTIGSAGFLAQENKTIYFLIAGALLVFVSIIGVFIKKKYLNKKRGIILFTRIPSADKGKTRLRTHLTGKECETLQEKFILDTYSACKETGEDVMLSFGNEGDVDKLKSLTGNEPIYFSQEGINLGEKMANSFEKAFAKGYEQVILIGSDIPHIGGDKIKQSFETLDSNNVVINPTKDGGYYLIGLNKMKNCKEIFNLENYGGVDVLDSTIGKIQSMNLSYNLGEENFDIDIWDDLKQLGKILNDKHNICVKSREYIKYLLEKRADDINNSTCI